MCCVSSTTPEYQRLFFALWPDVALQEAINAYAHKLIGTSVQSVPAHNLHITLAFLGPVPRGQRDCYERAAAGVRSPAFTLDLRRIGHWPLPRIAWLGPVQQPEALLTLVQRLNAALITCGYTPEARPYRAHMTLVRKLDLPLPVGEIAPIDWVVDSFALVESVTVPGGPCYRVLERWLLQHDC